MDGAKEGGFETRKRKVEGIGEWVRKNKAMRIARFGETGNSWTAWIGKTKNFGDFIKTFTDGIIASRGDNFKMIVGRHADDLSMAARNDQGKEGKFGFFGEPVGINMRFEVMYWIERDVVQNADSASGKCTNEK